MATPPVANDVRVAFIFAGSPRSFIMPAVKKTIRYNLIDAFCPPSSCIYDVFARISLNDNNHVGISSSGVLTVGDESTKNRIMESIKTLEPPAHSGGHLYTEYYAIGSEEELEAMKAFGGNNFRHRMFRELDTRRYSMYYGRYVAYEMALQHEYSLGYNYTWIVHARFDAAWGEPLRPHFLWTHDRMYVHDSWWADIPDTFALLPRNISDLYYSVEELVKPEVMCLGGPNFDLKTIETDWLLNKGYNHSEISIIQAEDCKLLFPTSALSTNFKFNVTWSAAGFSETILKRKMGQYDYFVSSSRIGLVPLFMVLTRVPLQHFCDFVLSSKLIPYVKRSQTANAAIFAGCRLMMSDLKKYEENKHPNCTISKIIFRPGGMAGLFRNN